MARIKLLFPAVAALIAACQAPQAPPVSPSSQPSVDASATPAASTAPGASSQPTPVASAARMATLTGKIYDDAGIPVDGASVQVSSEQYPQVNQTITAIGGSFGVPAVPEGTTVRLKATKGGYTLRERVIEAQIRTPGSEIDPGRVDFGGSGSGMFYFLSRYPEIAEITPANMATGVATSPLKIVLKLSHPLDAKDRNRFEGLLEVRFQSRGELQVIRAGTAYHDRAARIEWDAAGQVATFVFDAPLVTDTPSGAAVTVGLNQSASLDEFPKSQDGLRLGNDRAPETREGTGGRAQNQVAVFPRREYEAVPSARPSALALWGLTHQTTSAFTLGSDKTAPEVVRVSSISDAAGDRFVVVFSKPMRGFPESAVDPSVLRPSNYRYFLGNTDVKKDRLRFEEADPRVEGSSPDEPPKFSGESDTTIVIPVQAGTFSRYSAFKLYVDGAVKDIEGNTLPAGGVVKEGTI